MLERLQRRIYKAAKWAIKAYTTPQPNPFSWKKKNTTKGITARLSSKENGFRSLSFHKLFFSTLPEHYPLSKKLMLLKNQSKFGRGWDAMMVVLSIVACVFYVAETYHCQYEAAQIYAVEEQIITQFFAADFIFNFLCASNHLHFLTNSWTLIDLATILPVYITLAFAGGRRGGGKSLSVLRFVRILRLVRILRTFKLLGGMSGVRRQIITLSLTLISLVFMAAGVIQIMENDVRQVVDRFQCVHIGPNTNWKPSCNVHVPYDPTSSCDCTLRNCQPYYVASDNPGEPTGVRCIKLTFLDAFYFMIVTVATVGYGDITPSSPLSRVFVIIFIVTSLIVIPMQVNQLTTLLSMSAQFRQPFIPNVSGNETHVILCGHVSDWRRLEQIFREFFHPDRASSHAPDFHILILSPVEPSENIKALLVSSSFDGHVTYLIGSALSMEDLQKARADIAAGMIFLCNLEASNVNAKLDDAATVLRTLSVTNYNPDLECLVQVIKKEDREILKDSNCEVVLCLDEFKTALQARNAICPGLSTMVENLFHTFKRHDDMDVNRYAPWQIEYTNGANLETYYIPLTSDFLESFSYDWSLLVEGILLEFDVMMIGVCSNQENNVIVNPSHQDIKKFLTPAKFFRAYNLGIILADDQDVASAITSAIQDRQVLEKISQKLVTAEEFFSVRKLMSANNAKGKKKKVKRQISMMTVSIQDFPESASLKDIIRLAKSRSLVQGGEEDPDKLDETKETKETEEANNFKGYVQHPPPGAAPALGITGTLAQMKDKAMALINATTGHEDAVAVYSDTDSDEEQSNTECDSPSVAASVPSIPPPPTPVRVHRGTISSHTPAAWKQSSKSIDQTLAKNTSSYNLLNVVTKMRGGLLFSSKLKSRRNSVRDLGFEKQLKELGTDPHIASGHVSEELEDANHLSGHVLLIGNMSNLMVFIAELRRDLVKRFSYHPIVVVSEKEPDFWEDVVDSFEDVYFIKGNIANSTDFNRTNIRDAFALVLMADRSNITQVEEENLDSDTLFVYLKLEKYIPSKVFFTVELSCPSDIAVLNSTVDGVDDGGFPKPLTASNIATMVKSDDAKGKNQIKGTFATQRKSVMISLELAALARRSMANSPAERALTKAAKDRRGAVAGAKDLKLSDMHTDEDMKIAGRRLSTLHSKTGKSEVSVATKVVKDLESMWTLDDTHHSLPVFASGRAFVPSSFDSLICQSFFSVFTPLLVEKLVCGQKYQTMFRIEVPYNFVGRYFVDVFRAFGSFHILVLGLYRAAFVPDKSALPFVYTSPKPDTVVRAKDKLYVYCNPLDMKRAMDKCLGVEHVTFADGRRSLQEKVEKPEKKERPARTMAGAGLPHFVRAIKAARRVATTTGVPMATLATKGNHMLNKKPSAKTAWGPSQEESQDGSAPPPPRLSLTRALSMFSQKKSPSKDKGSGSQEGSQDGAAKIGSAPASPIVSTMHVSMLSQKKSTKEA